MEASLATCPFPTLSTVPPNHELHSLVPFLRTILQECTDRLRAPLLMSQKIVQLLYKTPSQVGRDVYVTLLKELCKEYAEVKKEATNWLIFAEDEVSIIIVNGVDVLKHHAA